MHTLSIRDIITEQFQNQIQDSFSLATGFGVVFTDSEGNHLGSGGNFCSFCHKINETKKGAHYCALTNKHAIEIALKTEKPSIYICHAGLVNIEIPLIYEGVCFGAITAGQVLCSEENNYPRDAIADEINWMENTELSASFHEIRKMSCEQIEATASSLSTITNYIIQTLSYSQIQETLARKSEELLIEENRRIKLEQQLKLAQLDALQKQVTPHFIFNVINSISRLLSLKEYDTAELVLNSFAQMMRYSLADIHNTVTLEQELNYIRSYLAIQKIRFSERLDYEILCDNTILPLSIPFFSLQPLVENSIEHGLLNKASGGKLTLTCTRQPAYDLLCVEDNGIGIAEDILVQLRATLLCEQTEVPERHVGLYNCYNRFRLLFGNNLSFSISAKWQTGTRVTIKLYHHTAF